MTDIVTPTVLTTLRAANPTNLPDAIRKLGLGDLLNNLSAPKTDTGTIPGTPYQITLTYTPIQGSLAVYASSTGILNQRATGSPSSGQYTLSGKTVTFNSAQAAETYTIKYASVDAGEDGVTPLATALAEGFGSGT